MPRSTRVCGEEGCIKVQDISTITSHYLPVSLRPAGSFGNDLNEENNREQMVSGGLNFQSAMSKSRMPPTLQHLTLFK